MQANYFMGHFEGYFEESAATHNHPSDPKLWALEVAFLGHEMATSKASDIWALLALVMDLHDSKTLRT